MRSSQICKSVFQWSLRCAIVVIGISQLASNSICCAQVQVESDSPALKLDAAVVKPLGGEKEKTKRSSAMLLPTSTRLWVSVEDLNRLEVNLSNTQVGKLARQDTLAPFFASFEKQVRETLDNNGVKFGIDLASIQMLETGEISIAGVLPDFVEGIKPVRGSHGVVVLIDVEPAPDAAVDFLAEASEKMTERGATLEKLEINGTDVSKWSFEIKDVKVKRTQFSYLTVSNGWLLASDNESIFRKVLTRIKAERPAETTGSLAEYEPFVVVEKETKVEGIAPDLRWYVDPIGYARFADALAEDKAEVRTLKDRPLETLSKEGLDALKSAGGFVSFSTGKHDVLHRSMVYADPADAKGAKQKRLLALLDFSPAGVTVNSPPTWIPSDAAGYFTASWDIQKAFQNIGQFVNAFLGEGMFEDVIKDMKEVPAYRVDINKMVQSLGKKLTVVATTEEPIDEASEKMIVGVPLGKGVDIDWLIESIGRAVKGKVKKLAGFKYIVDDRIEVEQDEDDPLKEFDLDDFEDDLLGDAGLGAAPAAAAAPPRITLFNRRFFVIKDATLFVCNDKDYLKKILLAKPSDGFKASPDLQNMNLHLAEMTDNNRVRFRMFNRLDRMLKTNYEMMRQGRMAESETLVARILNQVYGKKAAGDLQRDQQIDGSELPEDFDKEIAPYLGQAGWVMEVTDFGWRFSGCVLPKKDLEKKASKKAAADDSETELLDLPK